MALTDLSRCSAASRHRGDPQAGTAPVASRWLLIEHPGPWSKDPLDTPPLFGSAGATRLHAPIAGIAVTGSGRGYRMVGRDGRVFSFGDAGAGASGPIASSRPIVALALP